MAVVGALTPINVSGGPLPIGRIDITPDVDGEAALESPSFGETVGAAFRQENLIGSFLSQEDMGGGDDDPDYRFWDDIKGTPYETYADRFANGAWNKYQGAAIKSQIDKELEDRRTLDASGWTGMLASLGAGILSPENLLPVGGLVSAGRLGFSVGKSAVVTGTSAALAAGVSEVGLHATQELRTGTESAFAIGGSAILGGILGAGAAHIGNRSVITELSKRMDADINAAGVVDQQAINERTVGEIFGSAGAAGVKKDSLDDLSIAGRATKAVGSFAFNPLLRALNSDSVAYRRISEGLMENPIYLKKNFEGGASAPAAETLVKEYTQGKLSVAVESNSKTFNEYRKSGGALKAHEFNEAVGKAMRRGDVSDDLNVTRAAQMWRKEVFDPLKDKAIEQGLLPPDVSVETATSYLSRIYNKPKIEANEQAFKGIAREWISGQHEAATVKGGKALERKITNLQSQAQDREMSINRRNAELQRRENGEELDVDVADERSITEMLRRIGSGEKIDGPERLSKWLARQGKDGVFDPNGDLAGVWQDGKRIPGMFRKTYKTDTNTKGGLGLDDLVQRAWDEGFIASPERPTIREFLDTLDEDLRGNFVVRVDDEPRAGAMRDMQAVEDALSRMGVDVNEKTKPLFATNETMKDMASKVSRVLDDLDNAEIARMKDLMRKVEDDHNDQFGRFVNDFDKQEYIDEIVNDVFNAVTGRGVDGDVPRDLVASKRGPLKERTFNIPDELIEDFLESDVEAVGRRYARTMAADVELQTKYGSTTMEPQVKEIREDYRVLRERLAASDMTDAKKAKGLQTLASGEKNDIADLKAMRDQLRGTYLSQENGTNFARVANGAMTFNYLRTMGGVTLSSLTDIGRHVMVHGFSRVMNDGLVPLVKNSKAVKLSVNEAKLAGTISERILNTRMSTWAELTDPYGQSSPIERLLQNTSRGFSKLNGMVYWNDFQKSFASVLTQNRILRDVVSMDTVKPNERAYLAFLGIDENMAGRIAKEFETHGQTIDGVRVANTEDWADEGARRSYRAAINKDVDSTIITKGMGDIPLSWKTPLGRLITQFKSFAVASHQRAFMRGMQEGKAGVVSGLMTATTIGMLIYYLKSVESNRMDDISDNPGRWIAEGLDRSGIFSVAFEANNTWEKFNNKGAYAALQAAFPDKMQDGKSSRYQQRGFVETIAGPTALFMDTLLNAAGEASDKDFSEKDVQALRNIAPFASLPILRSVVEWIALPAAKEAAGVEVK